MTNFEILNWHLTVERTGGNVNLARELLQLLFDSLPEDKAAINENYQAKNFKAMESRVHQLHGSFAYCGITKLKETTRALEDALKSKNHDALPDLLDQLNGQIDQVLEESEFLEELVSQETN